MSVRRVSASLNVPPYITSRPVLLVAPMVITLKPARIARISVVVRSSPLVLVVPFNTIVSVLVAACSTTAALPVTLLAPPLKSISSAVMVSAAAPAARFAPIVTLPLLSVTPVALMAAVLLMLLLLAVSRFSW